MYTTKRFPGKFEGNRSQLMAEVVYNASLDGCDRETGEADTTGWYGLIRGKHFDWIIEEDSQGFVTVDWYSSRADKIADKLFDRIEADITRAEEAETEE